MRRIIPISLILTFCNILAACSYRADFVIKNESDAAIEVAYNLINTESFLIPEIKTPEQQKNKASNWKQLKPNEFEFNKEKGIIKVSLSAGSALKVAHMNPFYLDKELDTSFNIKEISISGADGKIVLEGVQALRKFEPLERPFWGPSDLYQLNYKK